MGTNIFKIANGQIAGSKARAAAEVSDFARLTLTDIKAAEIATTTLDIDQHIGLAFASPAGAQGQGGICIKDPISGGFVELSISLASGRLVGATLVGRPSCVMQGKHSPVPKKHADGLPLFAQHGFAPGEIMPRSEFNAALTLEIAPDAAYVFWCEAPVDQRVDCNRAFFTFANGQLIGFGAARLTEAELAALFDSLG
jgi:hypothetical protein